MSKKRKPIDLAKAAQAVAPSLIEDIKSIQDKSLALEIHEKKQRALAKRSNETPCEHARRLAKLDERERANAAATREQAFMDSLFPDRSQYVNHGDHTYTICGLRWRYEVQIGGECRLYVIRDHPDNRYRSTRIFGPWEDSTACNSLSQFGAVLLRRDEFVEFIDETYPNTFWGRIRLWFNYRFL